VREKENKQTNELYKLLLYGGEREREGERKNFRVFSGLE
jgi:hypothetical protein